MLRNDYGLVAPQLSEMSFEEPEIVNKAVSLALS